MEICVLDGLPVALVDVTEALTTAWGSFSGRVDVVRVVMPPAKRSQKLREAGFLPKPARLSWLARTQKTEDEFLAGLSFKDRQNVRIARRRAAADGIELRTVQPLHPHLLDAFLTLYQARVAEMRHGVPIASEQREAILAAAADYFAVTAHIGPQLVGTCIAQEHPADDLVQLRFSAVDPQRRNSSLVRILYLNAVQVARNKGYGHVGLGTDPNLYGHLVKPGLFAFKWRLGFSAVPSQSVRGGDGFDEADLILGSSSLVEPILFLSYPVEPASHPAGLAASSPPCLWAELFSRAAYLDTRPYQARFLAGVQTHRLT